MEFDITPVLKAVLGLISICITTFLIPYIKSKTTNAQQEEIQNWVKLAVMAAEQLYQGQGRGEEKKEYVIEWLKNHNIKLDSEQLDLMIEAAVYELINNLKPDETNSQPKVSVPLTVNAVFDNQNAPSVCIPMSIVKPTKLADETSTTTIVE